MIDPTQICPTCGRSMIVVKLDLTNSPAQDVPHCPKCQTITARISISALKAFERAHVIGEINKAMGKDET